MSGRRKRNKETATTPIKQGLRQKQQAEDNNADLALDSPKRKRKLVCSTTPSKARPVVKLKLFSDDDLKDVQVEDIKSLKPRRASAKPTLGDVAEVSTEDDDEDTKETLSVR